MDVSIYYLILVFVITTFSMVLHELAHGIVAYWLGDDTAKNDGRLSLNPLKHIDPVMTIILPLTLALVGGPIFGGAKPVPINTRKLKWGEWGFALVAIAGPLTNFILAFICFLIGHFSNTLMLSSSFLGIVTTAGMMINLGFMIFNLIPIPPLDGSRVLYALAPDGFRDMMQKFEQVGLVVVLALVWIFGDAFSAYMTGAMAGVVSFFNLLVGA